MSETYYLRAQYLGETDNGIKVYSRFLAECDAKTTLAEFKASSVSKDAAPFFIDLCDDQSTIIESVGVTEETYGQITGEVVLSYTDYEQAAQFHEDLIFGAMQQDLREKGVDVPENDASKQFDAALKLHKFRQSDRVLQEVKVDNLALGREDNI